MQLVTREVYEGFVKDLINTQGVELEDGIEAVEQIIDEDGAVRAQVIYFPDVEQQPQYMIDKRIAWSDTVRRARADLEDRSAVIDSIFPSLPGISIDG